MSCTSRSMLLAGGLVLGMAASAVAQSSNSQTTTTFWYDASGNLIQQRRDWTCGDEESLCGNACLDLTSDVNNCGACGRRCYQPSVGAAMCVDSKCDFNCGAGYTKCEGTCKNNTTDFQSDMNNCGRCGNVCVKYDEPDRKTYCATGQCQQCNLGEDTGIWVCGPI